MCHYGAESRDLQLAWRDPLKLAPPSLLPSGASDAPCPIQALLPLTGYYRRGGPRDALLPISPLASRSPFPSVEKEEVGGSGRGIDFNSFDYHVEKKKEGVAFHM